MSGRAAILAVSHARVARVARASTTVCVAAALVAGPKALAAQAACDPTGWTEVVTAHLARYPLLGVEDAYKLIHQGVFGTEHARVDVASAAGRLEEELSTLRPRGGPAEELTEAIAPGGRLVRVHLRPFIAAGGDPEALLVAFLNTATSTRGRLEDFRCAADGVQAATAGRWSEGVWSAFVERMVNSRLPAIEHSEPFEAVYGPAYRVVAADFLPLLEAPSR